MQHSALSFLAFMEDETAQAYLSQVCYCSDTSIESVRKLKQEAKKRAGPPTPKAGKPNVQSLRGVAKYQTHLEQLAKSPAFGMAFGNAQWDFALVEIDPLLTWQFHVLCQQSQKHCAHLSARPSVAEMLPLCLPIGYPAPTHKMYHHPAGGVLIEAPDGNITLAGTGPTVPDPNLPLHWAGAIFMPPPPWVVVKQFGQRFYLANGNHRVYGLRQLGVTHVPCVVARVNSFDEVGTRPNGTLSKKVLASANPPTCGHYAGNRLFPVEVRNCRKFIHVSWSEYIIFDDAPPLSPVA